MSEIQYVMVGGNEHLRDLKCVPSYESSPSLTHGNLKKREEKREEKHTHTALTTRSLALHSITASPQSVSLLSRALNDFHEGETITDLTPDENLKAIIIIKIKKKKKKINVAAFLQTAPRGAGRIPRPSSRSRATSAATPKPFTTAGPGLQDGKG